MRRIGTINKKRRTIYLVIISIVAIFMATGYSILTDRLTIKGSTNLYASENYLWKKITKDYGVNTNSGLVENPYVNNKYSYTTLTPNNYITFNGTEVWRILSIESDNTIKIAKLNSNINNEFDTNNTETSDGYYCVELDGEGCNAWHKRGAYNNKSYMGEVLHDSSINNYLNTTFYNSLDSTSKRYIVNHEFNIGAIPEKVINENDVESILEYEISDTWTGNVGTLSISDLKFSFLNESYINSSISGNKIIWLINSLYDSNTKVWTYDVSNNQALTRTTNIKSESNNNIEYSYITIPVVYLNSFVEYVSGDGTIENPFEITMH